MDQEWDYDWLDYMDEEYPLGCDLDCSLCYPENDYS